MGIVLNINEFKCFNQLKNGEDFTLNTGDFTSNLVANIGERIKVQFNIDFNWFSATEGAEKWFITNQPSFKAIERNGGNFKTDGWQIGDRFQFRANWIVNKFNNVSEFVGSVDAISEDGRIIEFSLLLGTILSTGERDNVGIVANSLDSDNLHTAFIQRWGLNSNEEAFNFLSKVTEAQQEFYLGQLGANDITETALSLGKIKDWVTGGIDITFNSVPPRLDQARYVVEHTFTQTPFFVVGWRQFLDTDTIPPLLQGGNALKYALQFELRKTLNDTTTIKNEVFNSVTGSTGWFGENFNGFNNLFEVASVSFEDAITADPLDAVSRSAETKVTILVSKIGGVMTASYNAGVYISLLPQNTTEYVGTETDLSENFLYGSLTVSGGTGSNAGTGVINNITTSIVGDDLQIEAEIEYTTAQKLRLTSDSEYLLWVQVEDNSLVAGNSDRTPLIADRNNYAEGALIEGLAEITSLNYLTHNKTLNVDTGQVNLTEAWNEDGLLIDATLRLETTKEAFATDLTFSLVVENTVSGETFDLDSFTVGLENSVITAGNIQQIQVDTTRGYVLKEGDQFNLVRIEIGAFSSPWQEYSIAFAQKIRWQDWIRNPDVFAFFFDDTQPNNNQNFKSSNYSNILNGDYEIKLRVTGNLTGLDDLGRSGIGFLDYLGGNISVFDYGVPSGEDFDGTFELLDPDTLASTGQKILTNKDTLFRARYTTSNPVLDNLYGIHSIQKTGALADDVEQLSSIREPGTNPILKPLAGEQLLMLSIDAGDVISECLIDHTRLEEGVNYDLTARIDRQTVTQVEILTFQSELLGNFTASVTTNNGESVTWDIDGVLYSTNAPNVAIDGSVTPVDIRLLASSATIIEAFSSKDTRILTSDLDVSAFTFCESYDFDSNIATPHAMDTVSFPVPDASVLMDLVNFQGSGLTGTIDISNFTDWKANAQGWVFSFNPLLTAITEPNVLTGAGSLLNTNAANSGLLALDLSNSVVGTNGNISVNNNSGLVTFTVPNMASGTLKKLEAQLTALVTLDSSNVIFADDADFFLYQSVGDTLTGFTINMSTGSLRNLRVSQENNVAFTNVDLSNTRFNNAATVNLNGNKLVTNITLNTSPVGRILNFASSTSDAGGAQLDTITNLSSQTGVFDINNCFFNVENNNMSAGQVDTIIIDLDTATSAGTTNKTLNIGGTQGGNAAPTGASAAAIASLQGKGWTVNTN